MIEIIIIWSIIIVMFLSLLCFYFLDGGRWFFFGIVALLFDFV